MKRKMRRFAEGGLGYEEDPQPGVQSDREDKPKKPAKTDKPRTAQSKPRSMSNEEFIKKYKDSPASDRIKEEASKSVKKDKASRAASGTRMDFGGVSFGDPEMTREEQESIAKNTLKGAAAIGSVGAAGSVGPAVKAVRLAKTYYDSGKRVHNMTTGQQATAIMNAAKNAKKSGGSVSSASKRADGCATKGKTKGRFV